MEIKKDQVFETFTINGKLYTKNPNSGKNILIGGPTFKKIFKGQTNMDIQSKLYKEGKGKYKDLNEEDFCGPAGDVGVGNYPVNTLTRCRSALSNAKNARNPEGIVKCAVKKALKNGWKCGTRSKQVNKLLLTKKGGSKRTHKNIMI